MNTHLCVRIPLGCSPAPEKDRQGGSCESCEADVSITGTQTARSDPLYLTSRETTALAELLTQTKGWVAPPGVVGCRNPTP